MSRSQVVPESRLLRASFSSPSFPGRSCPDAFISCVSRSPPLHLPLGSTLSHNDPPGADNLPHRDSPATARSRELAHLFQQPDSPVHCCYEICRAYFHEGATADQLADRFGLHAAPSVSSSGTSLATRYQRVLHRQPARSQILPETHGDPATVLRTPPPREDLGRAPRRSPLRGIRRQRILSLPPPPPRGLDRDPAMAPDAATGRARQGRLRLCPTSPMSAPYPSRRDGTSPLRSPASSCSCPCYSTSSCLRPSPMRGRPARSRSRPCRRCSPCSSPNRSASGASATSATCVMMRVRGCSRA